MADDCYTKILGLDEDTKKKLFGDRKVPEKLLRRFVDDVMDIRSSSEKNPELGSFGSRVNKYISQMRQETDEILAMQKADLPKLRRMLDFAKNDAFKGDGAEALRSRLSFGFTQSNEGKYSAEALGKAIGYKLNSFVTTRMSEADMDVFMSGQMDKQIGMEVRALGTGVGKGSSGSEIAARIAGTVYEGNQLLLREMRLAGAPTRVLEDFVSPLRHNRAKMLESGKEAWIQHVRNLPLDRERTFGAAAGVAEKEAEILSGMYDRIVGRKSLTSPEVSMKSFGENVEGVNLSNRLAAKRTLKFLNYEGEHTYQEAFGHGTLAERIFDNYSRKGKDIGLIELFGNNPEKNLNTIISKLESHYRDIGDNEAASKIRRESANLRNILDSVSGKAAVGADNWTAKIGEGARAVNVLSKLSLTGVRAISNFATQAASIKSYTGKGFLEAMLEGAHSFGASVLPGELKSFQKMAGIAMTEFSQDVNGSFLSNNGIGGKMARWMFKYNGQDFMNEHVRATQAKMLMAHFGEGIDRGWGGIDAQSKATMLSIGIGEKDFTLLKHAVSDSPNGQRMLMPESIANLPDDLVKARAKELRTERGGQLWSVEKYKTELENRYRAFMTQAGDVATTTAGAREGAIFNSAPKGTIQGEGFRVMGQFKTFWLQANNIMKMIINAKPDLEALEQGVLKPGKRDFVTPAQWMIASAALGYVGQSLIDAANGKAPERPDSPQTWFKAMARGGAGGMYADILFGDAKGMSQFGVAETMLGPTIGQLAGPVAKLWGQTRADIEGGKGVGTNQEVNMALRLIRNNIPFQNAPGASQLLNYVMYDQIQNRLTPGYADKRAMKEAARDAQTRIQFNSTGSKGGGL